MNRHVYRDSHTLAKDVAQRLTDRLRAIQGEGRVPRLVLTGGRVADLVYRRLDAGALDWSSIDFYWGDERFVPADHPDNNAFQARNAFLDRVGADPVRLFSMPAHHCDYSMGEAARNYEQQLPSAGFDIVLLGMGADGHVASLFPGHDTLSVSSARVVAEFASPKPPAHRLSLTLPALNNADAVWFLVTGREKADAVARAWAGDDVMSTPAAGVHGRDETLWFLDESAAEALP